MIAELYKATLGCGGRNIFSDLSFMARPGQRIAVVGGCGDDGTLVLQTFLGMNRLDSGWVCIDGEPVLPQTAACFRRFMAFVPRNFSFGMMTALDVVRAMSAEKANRKWKYSVDEVHRNLEQTGVDGNCVDTPFGRMDKAVAQRALMAVALMPGRPVVLLDEPTLWQDDNGRHIVTECLASPRFDDVATIVATHDEAVMAVCDRVIELS